MKKIKYSIIGLILLTVLDVANVSAQIWQIGYSSMTFVDPSRNNRQIPVNIFYPADVSGVNVPWGSPSTKRYPIIVAGHDEGTPYQHYQYMWDHWTNNGFTVIIPLTEMSVPMDVEEYGHDMAFIAQEIWVLKNDPNSFFYHRYNNRSCVMGHGTGGAAAVFAATYYTNFTTLITLAANETPPGTVAAASQVTRPSVVVAAGQDCVSPVGTVQESIFNNINTDCKAFINFTEASRCHFAQNAGVCISNDIVCNPVTAIWQSTALNSTWYLISFMRYYLKFNTSAMQQFEWKLQQKEKDLTYIVTCSATSPKFEDENYLLSDEGPAMRIRVYPNPVSKGSELNISVISEYDSNAKLRIYDVLGGLAKEKDITLNELQNDLTVSINDLATGRYIISVTAGSSHSSAPLIIQ